jgi:hypothetical protein
MEKTTTIYHRDGREQTIDVQQASRVTYNDKEWSFHKWPPLNWERETPKYRATRDLQPAQMARHRLEPPFEKMWDSDIWQYGERPIMRGEIIESRTWPHESFLAMNYSAGKVLDFFTSRTKSRLPHSPWFVDRIRLDDGLTGQIIFDVRPPQMQPVDLRQPMDLRPGR